MTTPIYGLPELEAAQSQPEVIINEVVRQLEELIFDANQAAQATRRVPYDVQAFVAGVPGASQVVGRFRFARTTNMESSPSYATAAVAATALTDFDLQRNGVSFGTVHFDAGQNSGYFDMPDGDQNFDEGDVLTIVAPATPDATLADVFFLFTGELEI